MRAAFVGFIIAAIVSNVACVRAGSAELDINAMNKRIEHAVNEGAEWPKTPGGLAGILFGLRGMVMPREAVRPARREPWLKSNILFPGSHLTASLTDVWLEATISITADKTWRVDSIVPCDGLRAVEAEAELESRRQRSMEVCGLDYVTDGPLDFLEILKSRDKPLMLHPNIPTGWVNEADLPALVDLLDSDEPCAGVINMLSSTIDTTHSTVGNQAAYLIEGFQKDRYPPLLTTVPYSNIERLKQWWRERNGT